MSRTGSPLRIVSTIVLLTVIVKLIGFLRVLFMARVYGTGMEASAFEAAYRIPDLLFISIGIAIATTFIPIFNEHLTRGGHKEAMLFANNVVNLLVLVTVVMALLGIALAPGIVSLIYRGFQGQIYNLTVDLVRILFPIIIFIALSYIMTGLLQSLGEFKIPALISLPANVVSIVYLLFFNHHGGIYGFAAAVVFAWSLQLLIQVPALRKKGYRYKPVLNLKHQGLRKMLVMVVPIMLGSSVQQFNVIVNGALASGLGVNALAALAYANYIYVIIAGIFAYAVSAVMFPSLSRMYSNDNRSDFKQLINRSVRSLSFILIPIMIGLMLLSEPIVALLLQRGQFDVFSTRLTAGILFFYALGMLGYGLQELLNKAFYAVQNTRAPLKTAVWGMSLNIVLSIILVRYLELGGLALAASVSSIFIAGMLLIRLSHLIPGLIEKATFTSIYKVFVSAIIMGIAVYLYRDFLWMDLANHYANLLLNLGAAVSLGAVIYILTAFMLKNEEAGVLFDVLGKRLHRIRQEG
ncbi:MAG: murein biosynthesis integral membrane protein MurJ [Syntrophomonadaceae bacterium]|nr:murein biosynthesis integral membrane protein MurJ [Syntrophomonadaceae bacterium]